MAAHVTAARVQALLGSSWERSPLYAALADGLRRLIADGRIPAGTRLPSERQLTDRLAVSRTTVTRAYDLLREHGYLRSRQGSGSVATLPQRDAARTDSVLSPGQGGEDLLDLTCAAPVTAPVVAEAFEAAVSDLGAFLTGTGYFPSGLPALKQRIADWYEERGLPTRPDQVLVTNGALSAAAVVSRALTGVGDRVLVETPGYPNVLAGLQRSGVRLVPTTVHPDGWDLDALASAVAGTRPQAAFLVLDFHNPTGSLMPDAQRAELGRILRRSRTVAVVDETLVDMVLDDVAMPAPMAAHLADCVLIGSASKAFWGGLRIGWIRSPRARAGEVIAARLGLDLGAPLVEQLALRHLMDRREEVLRLHRDRARTSRDVLAASLRARLPRWRFAPPAGGLALWCELPEPVSTAVAAAAARHGLLLAPGPSFTIDGTHERFLRLPYTHPAEVMASVGERLADSWTDAVGERGPRRPPPVPLVA